MIFKKAKEIIKEIDQLKKIKKKINIPIKNIVLFKLLTLYSLYPFSILFILNVTLNPFIIMFKSILSLMIACILIYIKNKKLISFINKENNHLDSIDFSDFFYVLSVDFYKIDKYYSALNNSKDKEFILSLSNLDNKDIEKEIYYKLFENYINELSIKQLNIELEKIEKEIESILPEKESFELIDIINKKLGLYVDTKKNKKLNNFFSLKEL